jgi:hypothetical protein
MHDYGNIYTYLKFSCQKKAIKKASKYGITENMFFKMKEEVGITNWTKAKREYSRQLKQNEIIDDNIVQYEIIDGYGNIVKNDIKDKGNSDEIQLIFI